jgi:hypothetical protein
VLMKSNKLPLTKIFCLDSIIISSAKFAMQAREGFMKFAIGRYAASSVAGLLAVGLTIVTSTLTASAGNVDLFDGTFGNVTFQHWGLNVTDTPGVSSTAGDPGYAVFGMFSFNSSATTNAVIDNNLSYNPASGAITSLTWSVDKKVVGPAPATSVYRLLIEQNGHYYDYTSPATYLDPPGGYQLFSSGTLTAANFQQICVVGCATGTFGDSVSPGVGNDPSGIPVVALNLTNGGAIDFGILLISSPISPPDTTTGYYDNLNVDLATTPLPAALPLFATGLGGLGFLGWRRKRKGQAVAA